MPHTLANLCCDEDTGTTQITVQCPVAEIVVQGDGIFLQPVASGGAGLYTWTLSPANLGLSIDPVTGAIVGFIQTVGDFDFVVTATANGASGSCEFTQTVMQQNIDQRTLTKTQSATSVAPGDKIDYTVSATSTSTEAVITLQDSLACPATKTCSNVSICTMQSEYWAPYNAGSLVNTAQWQEAGLSDAVSAVVSLPTFQCPQPVANIPPADRILPESFGGVGNGTNNDWTAVRDAANAAASQGKWLWLTPGKVYALNGSLIDLPPGMRGIAGGGTIKITGGSTAMMFRMLPAVSDFVCQDCIFDHSGGTGNIHVFLAYAVKRVTWHNNQFINMGDTPAILVRAYIADNQDIEDVCISNNTYDGNIGNVGTQRNAFFIDGGLVPNSPVIDDWWQINYVPLTPANRARRCIFSDNVVTGGYYGFGSTYMDDSLVVGNTMTSQIRGIAIQQNSYRTKVISNVVRNSLSSAIHSSYGATDLVIAHNDVESGRALAWAGIQSHFNPQNLIIFKNKIRSSGLWYQGIALKVMADNNRILQNDIEGDYRKAGIVVQSSFGASADNAHTANVHQGSDWSNRPSTNNEVSCNRIRNIGAVPPIALTGVGDPMTGSIVNDNDTGGYSPIPYVVPIVTGTTATGNT